MARSLYEINQDILSCVDSETGEIIDVEHLSELELEREQKFEGVALWIKNLSAEAEAYKAEKEAFAEREKAAKNKIESLKNWLCFATNGEGFKSTKCVVTVRNSEETVVDEELLPKKWMKKTISYKPDKIAIKAAIKAGAKIKGAMIRINQNLSVK